MNDVDYCKYCNLTLIEPGGGRRDPPLRFFGHNSGYGYAIISNEPSKFRFL